MATIRTIKRKKSTSYCVGYYRDGLRRWISLGSNYTYGDAKELSVIVDRLVSALETGQELDRRTERWIDSAPDDIRQRLANANLITLDRIPTLGELFDAYWEAEYWDLKPTTQSNKRQSRRRFFLFADPDTLVSDFTKKDAARFVPFLDGIVGEATRAGTVRDVRRVFNWGVETDLIDSNPFLGLKRGSFKNKAREYYVSMDDYRSMLVACPNRMWRAVIALYRIGGLRLEEALRATWSDVDFPGGRLLIHSPKTERYRGRESRVIPLFPELRRELESYWEVVEEGGTPYIVATNRTTIRKHLERIVFYAGLNRWERLIQNLRSSRAIEVARDFGELAEAEWIGHSPQTAKDHYLHLLDDDFERALTFNPDSNSNSKKDKNSSRFLVPSRRDY